MVFPVFTTLLSDLQDNYCRYIHADDCKQETAQKLKVYLVWHTEDGLGQIKPFLHVSGRSGLLCKIAPLAQGAICIHIAELHFASHPPTETIQSSSFPEWVYLSTFRPYQFRDQ